MKKLIAIILAVCMFATLVLCSCEATPDVVAAEKNTMTLDNLDWKITVEGADKTEYTYADAKAHELSKITSSALMKGEGNILSSVSSFILQGIKLSEFLADVGKPDAKKITYYCYDLFEKEVNYTIEGDVINDPDTLIGWIMNKKSVLLDSTTYVGLFFPSSSKETSNQSLYKIVIE